MLLTFGIDSETVKGVLETLATDKVKKEMLSAMGDSYVQDVNDWIDDGQSFTSRTGRLQDSIDWYPGYDYSINIEASAVIPAGKYDNPKYVRGGVLDYAPLVEFGHLTRNNVTSTTPYPFIYADMENRKQRMLNAAQSVLSGVLNANH